MSRPARPEDVDEVGDALPGTWFGTSWGGVPTWLVPSRATPRADVLVRLPRLGEITRDGLAEVVTDAWRATASPRVVREHDA